VGMILNTLPYKLQRWYLIDHSLTSQQEKWQNVQFKRRDFNSATA